MSLKMRGNLTLEARREEIWEVLFDPAVLTQIMNKVPGVSVDRFERKALDEYEGAATIRVGMIRGKYEGIVRVVDQRAPEYVRLHSEAKGNGNWLGGELTLALAEQDGKTLLAYEGSGNVDGPIASLGQRMIDTVGRQFIANGTQALAEALTVRTAQLSKRSE